MIIYIIFAGITLLIVIISVITNDNIACGRDNKMWDWIKNSLGKTEDKTEKDFDYSKELEKYNIKDIENYLRKKKLKNLNK